MSKYVFRRAAGHRSWEKKDENICQLSVWCCGPKQETLSSLLSTGSTQENVSTSYRMEKMLTGV